MDCLGVRRTSPYSYDWDYMLDCESAPLGILVEQCDVWYQGGTGSSWSHSLSGSSYDLIIRLKVVDSDNPAYDRTETKTVYITDV